jgi:hypothetical protein
MTSALREKKKSAHIRLCLQNPRATKTNIEEN